MTNDTTATILGHASSLAIECALGHAITDQQYQAIQAIRQRLAAVAGIQVLELADGAERFRAYAGQVIYSLQAAGHRTSFSIGARGGLECLMTSVHRNRRVGPSSLIFGIQKAAC